MLNGMVVRAWANTWQENKKSQVLTRGIERGGINGATIGAVTAGGIHDGQGRLKPTAMWRLTM